MERISILAVLITVEVIIFLLPTTGLYILGLGATLLLFFSANQGGGTPAYLAITLFLLIPGYSLYSLWWLGFNYRKTSLQHLPRHIVVGTAVGSLIALLFNLPFLLTSVESPTQYISKQGNFSMMLIYGGGPLIVGISILLAMWLRGEQKLL